MKYVYEICLMFILSLLMVALYFNIKRATNYQLDIIDNGEIVETYECKEIEIYPNNISCKILDGSVILVSQGYILTIR